MGASCNDQRKAVAVCLQRSPCVLIQRNTPKKCLEDPELSKDLPELCMAQMKAFLECKRGMVDMTKRFRGNGALSTGKYDQQYENLSTGHFDAREELRKLEVLSSHDKK
ncbi:LAQU0S02e02168g1_1 [Lachancea quebecensis]|uniref:LAQU0S02e02168g1_1 n=1 Tax=Lachancea quebecensis TaxID=1654605 RepID=A0A0P1KN24_9SACH|nr:LAQU0S02e02168g1_1 [Lachancea quebecensis]